MRYLAVLVILLLPLLAVACASPAPSTNGGSGSQAIPTATTAAANLPTQTQASATSTQTAATPTQAVPAPTQVAMTPTQVAATPTRAQSTPTTVATVQAAATTPTRAATVTQPAAVAASPTAAQATTFVPGSGKEVKSITLSGPAALARIRYTPDGKTLVCLSGDVFNTKLTKWDIQSGKQITETGLLDARIMDLSSDGKLAAFGGSDKTVTLWDVPNWKLVRKLEGFPETVYGLAFSPDNKILLVGDEKGGISSWDVASGKQNWKIKLDSDSFTSAFAFSPDGKTFVHGGQTWPMKRNLADGALVGETQHYGVYITGLFYSPDGKTLYGGGGLFSAALFAWDATTLKEVKSYQLDTGNLLPAIISSPDGKLIAAGSRAATAKDKRSVRILDATSGQEVVTIEYNNGVETLAFSPDGKILAGLGEDRTIHFWEVAK